MNDPYGQQGGGYPGGQPGGYPGGQPGGGYPGGGYSGPGYPGGPGYPPQQDYQQQGYLQGGPVDFMGALRGWSQNIMNFNGRASRSAFWWFWLAGFIVDVVLQLIVQSAGSLTLGYLVSIVVFVLTLSVAVRRLHDSDKSGWLLLLAIIPILGWIALLVLYLLPGTPGPNRHG